MGQTDDAIMMKNRPSTYTYTPITRGHKPTPSQESNTLSEVSCTTNLSSGPIREEDESDRLRDFTDEDDLSSGGEDRRSLDSVGDCVDGRNNNTLTYQNCRTRSKTSTSPNTRRGEDRSTGSKTAGHAALTGRQMSSPLDNQTVDAIVTVNADDINDLDDVNRCSTINGNIGDDDHSVVVRNASGNGISTVDRFIRDSVDTLVRVSPSGTLKAMAVKVKSDADAAVVPVTGHSPAIAVDIGSNSDLHHPSTRMSRSAIRGAAGSAAPNDYGSISSASPEEAGNGPDVIRSDNSAQSKPERGEEEPDLADNSIMAGGRYQRTPLLSDSDNDDRLAGQEPEDQRGRDRGRNLLQGKVQNVRSTNNNRNGGSVKVDMPSGGGRQGPSSGANAASRRRPDCRQANGEGGSGDFDDDDEDEDDDEDFDDVTRYPPPPYEPLKTFLAALFLASGFLATTTSLAITHESVPDTEPLPDIFLDYVNYQKWGLDVSEILIMISTISAFIIIMLHSYRLIILRRIWFLLGCLYYYRAITMFVTVLPKSDPSYTCHPKLTNTTALPALVLVKRVLVLMSGMGLSINGKHIYCGDYIFSGHTMVLTMGFLVIKEYSPRRFVLLHWTSCIVSLTGVIMLLLARGHYTIDCVVAYYVTTRLWWVYHAMAHNNSLKRKRKRNFLRYLWWFHILRYLEKNIERPLPHVYSLPIPERLRKPLSRLGQRCRRRRGGGSADIERPADP